MVRSRLKLSALTGAVFATAFTPYALAQQSLAGSTRPLASCVALTESTLARPAGPMIDARIAMTDTGGAVTAMWDFLDSSEGLERWGGYASWSGPLPRQPLTLDQNIVGGACAPNVELRATVFSGQACLMSYAVHPPQPGRNDPLIQYGVSFDRPSSATVFAERIAVARFAEAHTDRASYIAVMGQRARNFGGTCDLEDRWQGNPVAPDAPFDLRLITFAPRQAPRSHSLFTQPATVPPGATPSLGTSTPAIALAVGSEGGLVLWVQDVTLYALSFGLQGTPDGPPRPLSTGVLGAPTVVARGRGFEAAWSDLDAATNRYKLVGASFSERQSTPPSIVLSSPPTLDSFAPAVSMQGSRIVLAWSEGSLRGTTSIRAGSSTQSLALAASTAGIIGPRRGSRRDPELASTSTQTWLLVQQFGRGSPRNGLLRLATLRCEGQ
ncbi:MAG: hypothetical protein Q8Q09_17415 [Deltaproteobacteria bacterium]|nr:hypothetical protein [Deltaproteobacteria bacterium]